MFPLQAKVAVVTGAGMGIGAAVARVLALSSASVAIADINVEAAQRTADAIVQGVGKAIVVRHDVTSWDSAFALSTTVTRALGPIDILVNNAGISNRMPFAEMTEGEWDRVLDINLKGQFLTTRGIVPQMIERKRGRIVNVASVTSKRGYAAFSHYCASKFGVMGLTQRLAAELALRHHRQRRMSRHSDDSAAPWHRWSDGRRRRRIG